MSRCRFYNSGYCKFGDNCKYGHQTLVESFDKNLKRVEKKCFDYEKGNCIRYQCKYAHVESETRTENLKKIEQNRIEMEELRKKWAEEDRQKEIKKLAAMNYHDRIVYQGYVNTSDYNIFALPDELTKIILSETYLSDVRLVCQDLNKKIDKMFPVVTHSISESFMNYVGHYPYEKARNIQDVIYQVSVKTIWCNMPRHCQNFECRGECNFCRANKSVINERNVKEYIQCQHFDNFLKKLHTDHVYYSKIKKQFEIEREKQQLFRGNGILERYRSYMDLQIYNTYFKLQNKTIRAMQ